MPKRYLIVAFLLLTTIPFLCPAQTSSKSAPSENYVSAPQVHLRLLAIKNLGLDLANGTFKTDYGRGMSVVSFDAKNNSGSKSPTEPFPIPSRVLPRPHNV